MRHPQSAVLAKILPEGVAVAEFLRDPAEARLYPQEEAAIAGAVPERRLEYATVRHCARLALTQLGLPPVAVPSGPDRAPIWPAGIVGSMTHCAGYRAAALAPATMLDSIGIDAEPHESLPDGLLRLIARPDELASLAALRSAHGEVHWDRVTFSAKESIYKAWYPLMRRWLGFQEASLRFDPPTETFTATVHQPGVALGGGPLSMLTGRWRIVRGVLLTTVVVARQNHSCSGDA
ncbi:4'-phosphopantetheinyl transferase superfamily protein [Micromonospora sp. NPDC049047]|uniref:4'-phosphopantetheinyl transferase family protein n=1 Tax=Micromonospora sp. NPDC049047 TaxID=3155645 RepID=UPI0033D0EB73